MPPLSRVQVEIVKAKPAEHDLPISTWNLARLADFLVGEGMVDNISQGAPIGGPRVSCAGPAARTAGRL
jgi:hypothetical protein